MKRKNSTVWYHANDSTIEPLDIPSTKLRLQTPKSNKNSRTELEFKP